MGTTTKKPEVWPTDEPLVVYITPAYFPERYSALMYHLNKIAHEDLKWDKDTVETIGLIAPRAQHVREGVFAIDDYGIDPRTVTLLVLWGDTAEAIGFEGHVPVECGYGFVPLFRTGVVLPVLRMPSIESGWWEDPLHQRYAETTYAEMIRQGRVRPTKDDYMVTISNPPMWN